jgi:hypothetical protein
MNAQNSGDLGPPEATVLLLKAVSEARDQGRRVFVYRRSAVKWGPVVVPS